MAYKYFSEIVDKVKNDTKIKRIALTAAADEHSLEAVFGAVKEGIVEPVLVGDKAEILKIMAELGVEIPDSDIYDVPDAKESCEFAVQLIRDGKADFLMKGNVDSGVYLKAVVDKEKGLGKGGVMSHFTMHQASGYHKLLVPVDGGMVTYPTLEQKKEIIENTVSTLIDLGYDCPKVGVLACVEKVNPKMPETIEANELKEMYLRGEIKNCIVEGPISYDCAVDKEIAKFKGFESPVSGDVDVFLAPNIHAANIMGKMLVCTCGALMAGFIVGAKCPLVMTSRGSSSEEKYYSIVLAAAASSRE